jgi:hypothetical protein
MRRKVTMIKLMENIEKEKRILNCMVDNSDGNLLSELILEQSRKVDKLIVAYQRTTIQRINSSNDKFTARKIIINV